MGAEIFGSLSSAQMSAESLTGFIDPVFESDTTTTRTQVGLNSGEFGIDLRPGFIIKNNTLLYARIGLAVNELTSEIKATTQDSFFGPATPESFSVHAQDTESKTGGFLRLGFGLEHYITQHLSLRGDYIYTYYGEIEANASASAAADSVNLGGPGVLAVHPNASSKVTNNTAMLGLSYYFEANKDAKHLLASDVARETGFDGFYVGGVAGGGFTQAETDIDADGTLFFAYGPYSLTSKVPVNSDSGMKNDTFTAGLHAGIGHSWNQWYLGAQIFLDYENIDMDTSGEGGFVSEFGNPTIPGETYISTSNSKITLNPLEYGIDLLPGYLLNPNMLFYARIGAAFNEATLETATTGFSADIALPNVPESFFVSVNSSESENIIGLRLGAGMEILLTEHLSLRGDYIYTLYPSINTAASFTEEVNSGNFGIGTYTARHDVDAKLSNSAVLLGISYYL